MEENKNYTEPEKIEQTESAEAEPVKLEETKSAEPQKEEAVKPKAINKTEPEKEKKSLGKKQWIIIGAAVLAVAVVVAVVIWLVGGFDAPEETTPEETTVAGKWFPAESAEDSPLEADPKREDIFYD